MTSLPLLTVGKAGIQYVTAPVRWRLADTKINAMQRQFGLEGYPGQELLDLMKNAEEICDRIKNDEVLGDYFILNNPWAERPWRRFNYWNGWYALSKLRRPARILEIGTAFGFSTIAWARGAGDSLKLLVSLDLGNFGRLFSEEETPQVDNLSFVKEGIRQYQEEQNIRFEYRQFAVNTQPPPYTDNEGNIVECPYWEDNKELRDMLVKTFFDIVFIDGKHTDNGLFNDLCSFFSNTSKGGLVVCDDIQHPDAAESMHRFIKVNNRIADYTVWRFLRSNNEYGGTLRRDQGLIITR